MSDFAATVALILVIASVLTAAAALISKAFNDGSLQADVRWVRRYISIQIANLKNTTTTN